MGITRSVAHLCMLPDMVTPTEVLRSLAEMTEAQIERFWGNVEATGGHLIWTGPLADGRPQHHLSRRPVRIRVRAYETAWMLLRGEPSPSQLLLNQCGEMLCIDPDHFMAGTLADLPHHSDAVREAEFWAAGIRQDNGCLLWRDTPPDRYGRVSWHNRPVGAHRLAWQLTHGAPPDDLFVCHHCDTPPCFEPSHLFLGTAADNTADMYAKGRNFPPPVADKHPFAKMTNGQVVDYRRRYSLGDTTFRELGDEAGVSAMAMWRAVRARTYVSVDLAGDGFGDEVEVSV